MTRHRQCGLLALNQVVKVKEYRLNNDNIWCTYIHNSFANVFTVYRSLSAITACEDQMQTQAQGTNIANQQLLIHYATKFDQNALL